MTLSWCFIDETTPYSRAVLASLLTTYAVAPALWPFEVANSLAIAERRQRINQNQVAEFLEALRRLPLQVERRESVWLCQSLIRLARELRLTAYDAAYLDLAQRENLPLATMDKDLQEAGRSIGIAALEI